MDYGPQTFWLQGPVALKKISMQVLILRTQFLLGHGKVLVPGPRIEDPWIRRERGGHKAWKRVVDFSFRRAEDAAITDKKQNKGKFQFLIGDAHSSVAKNIFQVQWATDSVPGTLNENWCYVMYYMSRGYFRVRIGMC